MHSYYARYTTDSRWFRTQFASSGSLLHPFETLQWPISAARKLDCGPGKLFYLLFEFVPVENHTYIPAIRTFELLQSFEHAHPFCALRTKFKANALESLDTFGGDLSLPWLQKRSRH